MNLELYNKVRAVPPEAQKAIQGGRLKGMTDINPMWRVKALTEQFGICGFGWKYEITKQWIEKADNGEISAFVNINLYIKQGGEWSEAIPGTGGSAYIALEKDRESGEKKPYVSDECFKMALTDAISVSCKALGFGADVYWDKDKTKYDKGDYPECLSGKLESDKPELHICADCGKEITATSKKTVAEILEGSKKYYQKELCQSCVSKRYKAANPQ